MKHHAPYRSLPALFLTALFYGCATQPAPLVPSDTPRASAAAPAAAALPSDRTVQAYVQAMRDDLSRGKVGIINEVMRLNSEESKTFWPIYQEYETELFALGDSRVETIRRFAGSLETGTLDNAQATQLGTAFFDFETKRIELLKKYYQSISERLSPVRAAQFTQIEHRTGTVIDLLIASEMPLIQPVTVGAK